MNGDYTATRVTLDKTSFSFLEQSSKQMVCEQMVWVENIQDVPLKIPLYFCKGLIHQ
jgi:hypothetical protein